MHYQKEVRRSLENSRRTPSKGETMIANHIVLCAAITLAIALALPHIIGQLFEVLLYV